VLVVSASALYSSEIQIWCKTSGRQLPIINSFHHMNGFYKVAFSISTEKR